MRGRSLRIGMRLRQALSTAAYLAAVLLTVFFLLPD